MAYLQGPDNKQFEIIRKEIDETPGKMEHNLNLLKEWISCQSHMPQNYDSRMLPMFLRGCKHNLERTKRKLEVYFVAKTKMTDIFANRHPNSPNILSVIRTTGLFPLPKLSPQGCRIVVGYVKDKSETDFNMFDVVKYAFMMADLRLRDESPISGDIYVWDASNLTALHIVRYVSPALSKAIFLSNKAYPARVQQIHLVNASPLAEKALNVTKSLVNQKLRNRFVVHKNVETLHKFLPPEVLPLEYGGNLGKCDDLSMEWHEYMCENKNWFSHQEHITIRGPVPAKLAMSYGLDDVYGAEGSFRQLEID